MTETVHGTADARFDKVRALLADKSRSGEELGASLTVDLHGQTIADLWGGHADAQRTTPWSADTIVNMWSCTKTVTNLAALMLVDRGLIDVFDWDKSTRQLAAQAPWWEPGTASGYHGSNLGHLVGEVVRRVTGKTLKEFVRTEIAEPLGADFQIGALPRDDHRSACPNRPPSRQFPTRAGSASGADGAAR